MLPRKAQICCEWGWECKHQHFPGNGHPGFHQPTLQSIHLLQNITTLPCSNVELENNVAQSPKPCVISLCGTQGKA